MKGDFNDNNGRRQAQNTEFVIILCLIVFRNYPIKIFTILIFYGGGKLLLRKFFNVKSVCTCSIQIRLLGPQGQLVSASLEVDGIFRSSLPPPASGLLALWVLSLRKVSLAPFLVRTSSSDPPLGKPYTIMLVFSLELLWNAMLLSCQKKSVLTNFLS